MRQTLALFFFFGLVAALVDRTWVALGTLQYSGAAPQPWWVPLQYGVMGVIAVYFAAFVTRYLERRDTPPRNLLSAFAVSGSWFLIAQLGGGVYDAVAPVAFALALFAVWLVRFSLLHRNERAAALVISLALGVAGTVGELLLVRLGIMKYPRAAAWGLPWWVPGLWLMAALFARNIAQAWFRGR